MEKWNVLSEGSKSVPHWQQHEGSEDVVDVKISRADQNFRVDILETEVRGIRDQQRTWHKRIFAVDQSLDVALKASIARAIEANIDQCLLTEALSCAHEKAFDLLADELGAEKPKPLCTVFEFRDDFPPDEVSVEVKVSQRADSIRVEIVEKTSLAGFVLRKNILAIERNVDALIQVGKLRASQAGIDDRLIDLALSEARIKMINQESQETAKS